MQLVFGGMMAYFSPGRVTLQQFVFIFVYILVVFGLYLGDNGLLQSKKSDFATIYICVCIYLVCIWVMMAYFSPGRVILRQPQRRASIFTRQRAHIIFQGRNIFNVLIISFVFYDTDKSSFNAWASPK